MAEEGIDFDRLLADHPELDDLADIEVNPDHLTLPNVATASLDYDDPEVFFTEVLEPYCRLEIFRHKDSPAAVKDVAEAFERCAKSLALMDMYAPSTGQDGVNKITDGINKVRGWIPHLADSHGFKNPYDND